MKSDGLHHELVEIPIEKIHVPDIEVEDSFKQSIDERGMDYPPIVKEDIPDDPTTEELAECDYDIVDGRRRLKSVEDLGWETVECFLPLDVDTDLLPVILNTQRSPNPAMESGIIKQKLDADMSQSQLADVLGISQGSISKRLKLQDLIDPLFEGVRKMKLGTEKGYKLAKLDEERQRELYDENGLDITNKQIKQERKDEITDDLDMESMENPEEEHMGGNRVHLSFEKDEATLIVDALEDYDLAEDETIDTIMEKIEGEL